MRISSWENSEDDNKKNHEYGFQKLDYKEGWQYTSLQESNCRSNFFVFRIQENEWVDLLAKSMKQVVVVDEKQE